MISFIVLNFQNSSAQNATQTIRGIVLDKQAQFNLPGVNVILLNTNPLKGTNTDANGKFKMTDVKPGRYDIKVSWIGYKEILLPNVVVTAGKETVLEIGLEENIASMNEVVVTAAKKK